LIPFSFIKPFYRGWKDFRKLFDVADEKAAKKYVRDHQVPVRYAGRSPTITLFALQEWWETLPDEKTP